MENQQVGTSFFEIYCRFLDKITDDMYLELSLEDTLKIIESIFMDSLPEYSYPRFRIGLYDPDIVTSDALDEEGNPVVTGAFVDTLTNEAYKLKEQIPEGYRTPLTILDELDNREQKSMLSKDGSAALEKVKADDTLAGTFLERVASWQKQ